MVLVIIKAPILPRGSIHTTIMELGPQNHNGDGLLGPNSIIVVYMDPLGYLPTFAETTETETRPGLEVSSCQLLPRTPYPKNSELVFTLSTTHLRVLPDSRLLQA